MDGVQAGGLSNATIELAAGQGQLAIVEWLLQFPDVDASLNDSSSIRLAARNGHLAVVECLLWADGVDVTAVNNAAIFAAASNGHLGVVERLLQVPAVCSTLNWFQRLQISMMTFRWPHCGARN